MDTPLIWYCFANILNYLIFFDQVSSGLREIFCFLAKYKLVDCIVTTGGGIEEDIIKCLGICSVTCFLIFFSLGDTFLGDFKLDGKLLRKRGLNRAGNLLIPNDNYCKFEDW